MKKLTLVKYNYDSFPETWRKNHPNEFKDVVFIYFGEVVNMPGHVYLQNIKTGKPTILHEESVVALSDEEV